MVRDDGGQLYTIEGVAAALIMLATAYMAINATSIYTAGDTHISDMQLETSGSDALTVMGTPANVTENNINNNTLRSILEDTYTPLQRDTAFKTEFLKLAGAGGVNPARNIQYIASYTCRNTNLGDTAIQSFWLSSSGRDLTGTEHPVRVTKWVIAKNNLCGPPAGDDRAVLVEVLLWLD